MTSGAFVQGKLRAWATRKGIHLQGSAGDRGAKNYTLTVGDNLFGGSLMPVVRKAFECGAGGELRGDIPTMSALHSSAAMTVNLFQYWASGADFGGLNECLELSDRPVASAVFESRFPVCPSAAERGFMTDPHLDFALRYCGGGRVGVECKLFEPYGRLSAKRLSERYLTLDSWAEIPHWRRLAERLCDNGDGYRRLDAAQLVKHALGLKAGAERGSWRLVYLYLDAPGEEAAEHTTEIRRFQEAIASDGRVFSAVSVQEFVLRMVSRIRQDHPEYVDYLAERYV